MGIQVWIRRAISTGLIAGVAMLYLAAVGLVESFVEREVITGYLTLGRLFLLAPPLLAGFVDREDGWSLRPESSAQDWWRARRPVSCSRPGSWSRTP